ncbi:MAG TPA: hypothetical protein DD827_11045 [Gammaproteobacteria bacterium]|nr:hypothetical protein [Gammaproteobacteria bacterium]
MTWLLNKFQDLLDLFRHFDFLGSLALRLYLAPIFWVAGMGKLKMMNEPQGVEKFVNWFGEGGLGIPYPEIMAYLVTGIELVGAVFLLIGFAVRWISIPLMVTMAVAAITVHWQNGWQAIADTKAVFASPHLGPLQLEDASAAGERLGSAKEILKANGDYSWLTEAGNFVVLNNGIEFAATYFIMLLALFFLGAGKFFSVDYWLHRRSRKAYVEAKAEKKRLKKARKAGYPEETMTDTTQETEFSDPNITSDHDEPARF